MTDEEKYYFDLCGYILVRNALTQEEVTALNRALDARWDDLQEVHESLARGAKDLVGSHRRKGLGLPFESNGAEGEACRSLLAHPNINPYLNEIIGVGFRLDHPHSFIVQEKGCEGHTFHGSTGPAFDPNQYYIVRNGKMNSGLTVVTWQLEDVNSGDGGFTLVPGSHKGNFPVPEGVRRYEIFQDRFEPIVMKAGDAVIFSETVLHGTLPWTADLPRRSILARYTAANLAYVPYKYKDLLEQLSDQLTADQKAVLEPPYHTRLNRPTL
ncbi:MAG: phytanoyl-CoA dioxygenase family protein [Planctomycetota bacterium]|nr:phytanoyl-CoA dioxygenase family protein [Planctomycetota bacterium]MDA1138845.1 phytanoyl-CoA dioxygenase family protein [Planctomycetota bacterium]